MLMVSRKRGESVVIATPYGPVEVTVAGATPNRVRLAIDGPGEVAIRRGELAAVDCSPAVFSTPVCSASDRTSAAADLSSLLRERAELTRLCENLLAALRQSAPTTPLLLHAEEILSRTRTAA